MVEGWYGQPFPAPLARTREYVDIVRQVLAREKPVTNDGPHYPLPYPGGTGLGKPLKSIVHPLRADIPIILGAEGPKNVALAAEIADGWFPIFFSPKGMSAFEASLDEGFARPGARRSVDDFEVLALAPTVITDDVDAAADGFRPFLALYIGGMGAKGMNFHFDVFARMGYEEAATKIQDAYLDGRKDDAAAAVPTALVEDIALIGPSRRSATTSRRGAPHAPPPCCSTATSPPCAPWPSWSWADAPSACGRATPAWRALTSMAMVIRMASKRKCATMGRVSRRLFWNERVTK